MHKLQMFSTDYDNTRQRSERRIPIRYRVCRHTPYTATRTYTCRTCTCTCTAAVQPYSAHMLGREDVNAAGHRGQPSWQPSKSVEPTVALFVGPSHGSPPLGSSGTSR